MRNTQQSEIFGRTQATVARAGRGGKWGDEFGYRRIPRGPVKRIEDPAARACYLCPADAWLPETMSHLLLRCPHAAMVRLRVSAV
jgi:hypothetical protein